MARFSIPMEESPWAPGSCWSTRRENSSSSPWKPIPTRRINGITLIFGLTVLTPTRYVLVCPIQNDVGDLKVVGPQHHHVRRPFEDRVSQLVQLDVFGLGSSMPGCPPRIDRVHSCLAHRTGCRVVSF